MSEYGDVERCALHEEEENGRKCDLKKGKTTGIESSHIIS